MNQPPTHCPYCGATVDPLEGSNSGPAETPLAYRCENCDDYVFHNPTPGGSAVVLDGDSVLLVEDFRSSGEWKLPSGCVELGETLREGVARELREETGLTVDPADLTYWYDESGEPVPGQHMVGVDYVVERADTTGTVEAGSDATDAQFFTPAEFATTDYAMKATHVDRFGTDSLEWVVDNARAALDTHQPAVTPPGRQ